MDIYCPRCAEPVELDYLHDVADENAYNGVGPTTFNGVRADFASRGCAALGASECEATGSLKAQVSAAMFDIMGDDVDGVAAMMDDFDYAGMLD